MNEKIKLLVGTTLFPNRCIYFQNDMNDNIELLKITRASAPNTISIINKAVFNGTALSCDSIWQAAAESIRLMSS